MLTNKKVKILDYDIDMYFLFTTHMWLIAAMSHSLTDFGSRVTGDTGKMGHHSNVSIPHSMVMDTNISPVT